MNNGRDKEEDADDSLMSGRVVQDHRKREKTGSD